MRSIHRSLATLLLAALVLGCASARPTLRPVEVVVDATLDPADHRLEARATLTLERIAGSSSEGRRTTVELELHPGLEVAAVRLDAGRVRSHRRRPAAAGGDGAVRPTVHRLVIEGSGEPVRMTLDYAGALLEDVAAGEREGEIHNLAVSAHIGGDGVFLEPDGYWYPRLELPDDADPALGLTHFRLSVDPIPGFELVAGLETDPGEDGRLHWKSPFPLDGLVLLGGPLVRASRSHGEVELHAVLAPGKQAVAEDILDASAEYLDRYTPLIGPYPYREFTVLEAFFSSGFAFPASTQIVGSQLSEHRQYRRHGYLDHELLHNWWGNGVLVDPRDGNWCEGLASYMGNYYGYVLDGDEEGARTQRRNQSNFLSAIEAGEDKPLGTFQLAGGAEGAIGYQKGAAVFHMLERKIGAPALTAGLRRLTADFMGRYASWEDLEEIFERASGVHLDTFFEQWVRRSGAPLLTLVDATWEPGADRATVTLSQGPTDFVLDVPLRLHYAAGSEDVVVVVDETVDRVEVPVAGADLEAIELDPDYHLFRKLEPEETMPTSALTRHAESLTVVVPAGELAEGYRTVVDAYTRAVLGEEEEPERGHSVSVVEADALSGEALASGSVLVVGAAARQAPVREFLARTRSPVAWTESGFRVEGEPYDGAGQAVLFTVHHPDRPEDGITVYYGNSEVALANARILRYYANSLLVFDTPLDAEPAATGAMPRTEVVRRIDFEFHDRIDFARGRD